jgi:hypothetical protein
MGTPYGYEKSFSNLDLRIYTPEVAKEKAGG